jgi:hypothetical protein
MNLARRLERCNRAHNHPMGVCASSQWQVEKVAIAPSLNQEDRQTILEMGYLPQSLDELTGGLL